MNPSVTQTEGSSLIPAQLVYQDTGLPLSDGVFARASANNNTIQSHARKANWIVVAQRIEAKTFVPRPHSQ